MSSLDRSREGCRRRIEPWEGTVGLEADATVDWGETLETVWGVKCDEAFEDGLTGVFGNEGCGSGSGGMTNGCV